MSNRVEELESKVSELQAAVDGLTEELVETKERLRHIESASDLDIDAPSRGRRRRAASGDETPDSDDDEVKADESEETNESEESSSNDIIVA